MEQQKFRYAFFFIVYIYTFLIYIYSKSYTNPIIIYQLKYFLDTQLLIVIPLNLFYLYFVINIINKTNHHCNLYLKFLSRKIFFIFPDKKDSIIALRIVQTKTNIIFSNGLLVKSINEKCPNIKIWCVKYI